jgi:hypothetical protein
MAVRQPVSNKSGRLSLRVDISSTRWLFQIIERVRDLRSSDPREIAALSTDPFYRVRAMLSAVDGFELAVRAILVNRSYRRRQYRRD